ncbi:YdeI/OmpD-associated family protein [Ferruginibacter sp.]
MPYSFSATIYKVGINPCVEVPLRITAKMTATKGYIPVKGKIGSHAFEQTLVPVKNAAYRLYVNGIMLAGAHVKTGDTVRFSIEQHLTPKTFAMPAALRKKLVQHHLLEVFKKLSAYRQKEILRYIAALKTAEARQRNMEKIIKMLASK